MNAGGGGSAAGERYVIVAAGVIHVPVQEAGIEALLTEPIGKRDAVQILKLRGKSELERYGERTGLAKFGEEIFEALKLIAVFRGEADGGLDALLPAGVEKQPLLRRKCEIAFFPLAIFQDSKILEKFADVYGLRVGDGNIVGSPGDCGEFVFTPSGVGAGL